MSEFSYRVVIVVLLMVLGAGLSFFVDMVVQQAERQNRCKSFGGIMVNTPNGRVCIEAKRIG